MHIFMWDAEHALSNLQCCFVKGVCLVVKGSTHGSFMGDKIIYMWRTCRTIRTAMMAAEIGSAQSRIFSQTLKCAIVSRGAGDTWVTLRLLHQSGADVQDPPAYYNPPGGLLAYQPQLGNLVNESVITADGMELGDYTGHFNLVNAQLTQVIELCAAAAMPAS